MIKSKWTKPVLDSLIHVSAWWLAWTLVLICFSDSSSRYVYATISAWWCALYVGYIRNIGLRSLLPLFIITINAIIIDHAFAAGYILPDSILEAPLGIFIFATVGPYLFFSSPVFINSVVRHVIDRVRGGSEEGAQVLKWAKPVVDSLIHFSMWWLAWVVILFLSNDSPLKYFYENISVSRYAYATISAWWCALYVGYIRNIGLRSMLPLFIITMSGITVSLAFGLGWFLGRHDAPTFSEATLNDFILATMVSYVILSSPVIINSGIRYVIGRRRPE